MVLRKRSVIALAASALAVLMMTSTIAAASPSAPVAVSALGEDGKVTLYWLPPFDDHAVIFQTGCDSMNMAMDHVYENFTSLYPNITVMLQGGGNKAGFEQWTSGSSDIDQASRALTAQERREAEAQGINVTETRIGVESVAVIADPRSGVSELTFEQLRGLLNGSITNWKYVGGNNLAVKVIVPPATGSPYLFVSMTVMAGSPFASTAIVADGQDLVDMVANTSGALAFTRTGFINSTSEVKCLGIKRALGYHAFLGNDLAAAYNGSYALSRYFRLYTDGPLSGAEAVWAAFLLDPQHGQRVLEDNGFLPLPEQERNNSTRNLDVTSENMQFQIVRRSPDGTSTIIAVNGTWYVDSNVTVGETYTYTVRMLNGTAQGIASSSVTVTVVEPPSPRGLASPVNVVIFILAVIGLVGATTGGILLIVRRR
jgi:phosphate transport system substrate-binding protein